MERSKDNNILTEICSYKKDIIAADKQQISFETIRKLSEKNLDKSNFQNNIVAKTNRNQLAIIAEIKKKSPSQGEVTKTFDVQKIASSYKTGGATCISVLTDKKYFDGDNSYVKTAKTASNLPILRKDFIIDPYQIYQSKLIGSSAILLIMSCLSLKQAIEFEEIATSLNLDVLVETHNESEIKQAIQLKTKLVGINNRNLKNLETSLDNVKNLFNQIPDDKVVICESGINSKSDLTKIKKLGIYSFLIGGYFMKQSNITAAFKKIMS